MSIGKNEAHLGPILTEVRNLHHYSLTYVAKKSELSIETLRRAESNMFESKISTLNLLSDFYRIDLLELFARSRTVDSFFSEDLIKAFNRYTQNNDYEGLKKFAAEMIVEFGQSKDSKKNIFIDFLDAISKIKYKCSDTQIDTISNVETLLLKLNDNYYSDEEIRFPYPIEVSTIIFLCILYRQTGSNEKAIKLIMNTIRRIKLMPYLNDRYIDYLSTLYLNLSYSYHCIEMDQMVITTVNEVFNNSKLSFNGRAMFNFLFRKGIAMYRLKDKNYLSVLISAVLSLPIAEQDGIIKLLKNEYDIYVEL